MYRFRAVRRRQILPRGRLATVTIGIAAVAGLLLSPLALAPAASAEPCVQEGQVMICGGGTGGGIPQPKPIPSPPTTPPPAPGPSSGHFLGYVRSPDGTWHETDLTAALPTGTSAQGVIGISAHYDSVTGAIEAYAENNSGHLIEIYQFPGTTSWSSSDVSAAVGGTTINGTPFPVTTSAGVDVFALSSDRQQLLEFAWTEATGWAESVVGASSLNTALVESGFTSDPQAVWDGQNLHVYISEITSSETIPQVTEFYSGSGGPWQRFTLASSMDNPSPVLAGGVIDIAGRQDIPCNGSACGGFTYGHSGHVLLLTEPVSSPGSVTATDVTASSGLTVLPASSSATPATTSFDGGSIYTQASTATSSSGGDIPLLEEYFRQGSGGWQFVSVNMVAAGATPLGEEGIGDPATAQDTQGGLNILIDNATGPGNGYDLTGAGDLQDYRWDGSSWQATDITATTGSPPVTKYPTAVGTPQGYVYAFAAQA